MTIIPVVAVVDIGKTNKKILLFDEQYRVVFEESERMEETNDEDGFPCEDLNALQISVINMVKEVLAMPQFSVKAINFTTYGASFVYVDHTGKALTPLYNYLKPYPAELQKEIYETNGGSEVFVRETSSPSLGSLNSGLQVLRLAREQPATFAKVAYALHLPQYISSLFTGKLVSDITSIGCHTHLWDFTKGAYHKWIESAGLLKVMAPIVASDHAEQVEFDQHKLWSGIGLHDSSAALIPYLVSFSEPFVLISTGTWSISLNPFDQVPLTDDELAMDCLCYLQYTGKPVKASRFFLGPVHESAVDKIAAHFAVPLDFYTSMQFSEKLYRDCIEFNTAQGFSTFDEIEIMELPSPDFAYYLLMIHLVRGQIQSTEVLLKHVQVGRILVDGGFSRNEIFMEMLADTFSDKVVCASEVPQATAMGAALAIHRYWNRLELPAEIISLKQFGSN